MTIFEEARSLATRQANLDVLTDEDLRQLAGITAAPAISIYCPTERANIEPEKNSLRLRDLIARTRSKLKDHQVKSAEIQRLLEPLEALLRDREYWLTRREGLALFRTADTFRDFTLTVPVAPTAYVSESFILRPLLKASSPLGEFYILALSHNRIRLLRCSRDRVQELDLAPLDIPLNLDEALRYDDLQKPDLQFHRGSGPNRAPRGSGGPGRGEPTFHGHGDDGIDQKDQLLRFFQAVDPGIRKLLNGTNAPLILAGVEYLRPIYREASDYALIASDGIDGNPDGLRPEELLNKSRPIFDGWVRTRIAELGDRYGDLAAHGKGSSDLADILGAAMEGRIDTLLLKEDAELWGLFDASEHSVTVQEDPTGAVELYDLAARHTILGSGHAYLLPAEEMIGGGPIAAIYRY
jgi:hypothetical protein